MPYCETELRLGARASHEEQQRQTGPLQQHTTLKSGCKVWRKMLPKWRREMAKQVIMGLSRGTFILNVWVEVEDSIEDRVPSDY